MSEKFVKGIKGLQLSQVKFKYPSHKNKVRFNRYKPSKLISN